MTIQISIAKLVGNLNKKLKSDDLLLTVKTNSVKDRDMITFLVFGYVIFNIQIILEVDKQMFIKY